MGDGRRSGRSYLQIADSAGGEEAERAVGTKALTAALPVERRRRFTVRRARHVASLRRPDVLLLPVIGREPRLV